MLALCLVSATVLTCRPAFAQFGDTHPILDKLPATEIDSFAGRTTLLVSLDAPTFFEPYTTRGTSARAAGQKPFTALPAATRIVCQWVQTDGSRPLLSFHSGKLTLLLPGLDGSAPPAPPSSPLPTFVLEETTGDPDDAYNSQVKAKEKSPLDFSSQYRIRIVNSGNFPGLFAKSGSKDYPGETVIRREFDLSGQHLPEPNHTYSVYLWLRPVGFSQSRLWHRLSRSPHGQFDEATTFYDVDVALEKLEVVDDATDHPIVTIADPHDAP